MRLDILLNKLCLVKTRSIAKNACDKGAILVNSKAAKASVLVRAGDVITCNMFGFQTTIRIDKLPAGNVAKKDVLEYYSLLGREKVAE